MKKLISLLIAVVMVFSLTVPAMAADDLVLENFDSSFDSTLMNANTGTGFGMPIFSTTTENTEIGEGLKAEWGTTLANGSSGEAQVHQMPTTADWSTTTFAQNADNYDYMRFWISNPTHKEILIMTRLYTDDTKVHFRAERAIMTNSDGTDYPIVYSNDITNYNLDKYTTLHIPGYFSGWIAYPITDTGRTSPAGSSRPALSSYADVNTIEFDFRLKDRTTTQGYYYVLDELTLSDSPYGAPVITVPKAKFDISGISPIEADEDGNVTLPAAEVSGKQFVGWQHPNGTLYKAGEVVAIEEDTNFKAIAVDINLQTGAGIRWAADESERGIRFETYVNKDVLDNLGSSKYEIGALILPYANYDANITVDNAESYDAINVVDPKVYGKVGDNYRYYTGVVDFEKYFNVSKAALADLKLTAVSYIKIYFADGTHAYYYDTPDATDNVRTVSEVARAALADTEANYNENQTAILNLYTQYSEQDTVPTYRKEDADAPNYFDELEYKFLVDITDKVGDGFFTENMNNGDAINNYTPAGNVDLYSHSNFSSGNTLTFTLPENFAEGTYAVSFNTRGSNSNRVTDVKIEVSSSAGSFVVSEHQSFMSDKSSSWWLIECENNVEIKGAPTFKFTSQSEVGKISLYDIVIKKVN